MMDASRKLTVTRSTITDALCGFVRPWRGSDLPVGAVVLFGDVGVGLDDVCEAIERLDMADEALPLQIVRTLELFDGATYAHASALLLWAYEQPIELTDEEQAEAKSQLHTLSEAAEALKIAYSSPRTRH